MSAGSITGLVDAHAHLQADQFTGDREAVLARARTEGLSLIVCAADDLESSRNAVALAAAQPDVVATVGVHPHEATSLDATVLDELAALARADRVVAIGEIGLDYYRDNSPREAQRDAFMRQLELALRLDLPIVVHSRDAADDTYAILAAWAAADPRPAARPRGLMHCFSYDAGWVERFLDLGLLLSVPGTVTYPSADAVRQVAAMMPEEALTVETDCPYLAPQRWRGRRNEPAYLTETVRRVAAVRGIEAADLGRKAGENALRLYRLAQPAAAWRVTT